MRILVGVGFADPCGICLHKPLSNIIHSHSLGVLGMDLACVHHAGQCFLSLALNLAQHLWQWSYSYLLGSTFGHMVKGENQVFQVVINPPQVLRD